MALQLSPLRNLCVAVRVTAHSQRGYPMKNTVKILAAVLALAVGSAGYVASAEAAMMMKKDHMMMKKHHKKHHMMMKKMMKK